MRRFGFANGCGVRIAIAGVLAVPAIAIPTQASAQDYATVKDSHDGFFARLSLGVGFGGNRVKDDAGVEKVLRGGAGTTSIALGAFLVPNLAVHGDIFAAGLVEPQVVEDGEVQGEAEGRYALFGVGAGITYYFMPANFYISAALGFTVLHARVWVIAIPLEWQSEPGAGLNLVFGKEWLVGGDWGVGIAGQFIYSVVPSEYEDPHHSFAGAVLFSASYG